MAGNECTSRGFSPVVYDSTYIVNDNACVAGDIVSWCVYMDAVGKTSTAKLKIFQDDGTNYNYVTETSSHSLASGLNTFTDTVTVSSGDLIAVYFNTDLSSNISATNFVNNSTYRKSGDITSNSAKSGWSDLNFRISCGASIASPSLNVYVNSSTGSDSNLGDSCTSGHPVLTFARAYTLLISGGTIHVCNSGADFSSETVTLNKSFSIDLNGSSGNFYGPKAS